MGRPKYGRPDIPEGGSSPGGRGLGHATGVRDNPSAFLRRFQHGMHDVLRPTAIYRRRAGYAGHTFGGIHQDLRREGRLVHGSFAVGSPRYCVPSHAGEGVHIRGAYFNEYDDECRVRVEPGREALCSSRASEGCSPRGVGGPYWRIGPYTARRT